MMNKMRVDYGEAKIILARSFAKKAAIVGSSEYLELQECREKHPNFKVILRDYGKNTAQEHYKGMTYEYMVEYILRHELPEKRDEMLKNLSILRQDVEGLSRGHRYPIIKRWFLMSYPEVTTLGMVPVDTALAA